MANVNAVKYGIVNGQGFPSAHSKINNATFPFSQGDLCYYDTSAKIAKPVTADADAATLLGVALDPSAVSSNIDNTSVVPSKVGQFGYQVVAEFFTTAAETYTHGLAVYVGANAQTITTVAGSNPVGKVYLTTGQLEGSASVTGAANVKVQVLVFSRAFGTFA